MPDLLPPICLADAFVALPWHWVYHICPLRRSNDSLIIHNDFCMIAGIDMDSHHHHPIQIYNVNTSISLLPILCCCYIYFDPIGAFGCFVDSIGINNLLIYSHIHKIVIVFDKNIVCVHRALCPSMCQNVQSIGPKNRRSEKKEKWKCQECRPCVTACVFNPE